MFTVPKTIEVTSGFAAEQQNGSRNGSFGRESVETDRTLENVSNMFNLKWRKV